MKVETVEVTRPDGEKIIVNADEAAEYEAEKAAEDEAALETPKSRKRGGK